VSVTIVVWNVETFGDTWNAARGAAYAPLCNFMAQALYTVSTDILILEELRSGGVAYLPTLQAALVTRSGNANDVWNYDYIPGSILANIGYPILNAGNLGFTQQGHSEGYAVLWRDRAEFSVLGTRVALSGHPTGGKSRIGLVIEGRSGNPRNVPNPYWFTAPDFDPNRPPFAWPPLEFPEANPIHQGDTRWTLCRVSNGSCPLSCTMRRIMTSAPSGACSRRPIRRSFTRSTTPPSPTGPWSPSTRPSPQAT